MSEQIVVRVAGHKHNTLRFFPTSSCGSIKNGVAFENGNNGGWVISYEDFLKLAKAAKDARKTNPRPHLVMGRTDKKGLR